MFTFIELYINKFYIVMSFVIKLLLKSLGLVRFFYIFERSRLLTKAAFIWSKIQKNRNIVKYYNLKELFSILVYFNSLNFFIILFYIVFKCHMILQKSFYADLVLKKHFPLLQSM